MCVFSCKGDTVGAFIAEILSIYFYLFYIEAENVFPGFISAAWARQQQGRWELLVSLTVQLELHKTHSPNATFSSWEALAQGHSWLKDTFVTHNLCCLTLDWILEIASIANIASREGFFVGYFSHSKSEVEEAAAISPRPPWWSRQLPQILFMAVIHKPMYAILYLKPQSGLMLTPALEGG